ncbi:MAG: hypothetical protein AAF703_03630 [Cyanobacteria bacterium P01_D01_bin.105]
MFESVLPVSPQSSFSAAEIQWIEEALTLQQAAQNFRREVEHRQAEATYYQWYSEMVKQTQAEEASMENDVDVFGWFCGLKRSAR